MSVGRSSVKESWSSSGDNGFTTVNTRVTYGMRLGALGALADWLLVRFIVRREMRSGLRGLKEYVERRAERLTGVRSSG